MNRRIKSVIAGFLSLATILSLTACNGEKKQEEPERTTNAEFEPIVDHVKTLTDKVDNNIKVEKKITWLSWYPIDETQAAAELFKQVYGIPEMGVESYGKSKDNIFEYVYVAYNSHYDKLASMVSTGDSPDIFQFEITNFPFTAYKGMFQPIDGIIDTSGPEWDVTRDAMELFKWGGKNYCALTSLNLDQLMWYRRSVISEAGLEDPYELYKAGKWDWNSFLDMCDKFQQSGEGKYAVDGFQVPELLLITTGVPLIGLDETGHIVNNLYNADVERAINFVSELAKEDYRYPRHLLNNWSTNIPAWCKGDVLFYCDGTWSWGETISNYSKRYKWDTSDVFFVPFPKDPNSDKYYQSFKNDSYMLCSGSDNIEGFKAWIQCNVAVANDEETNRLGREQSKANYNWTDEQLDFLDELQKGGVLTPVFDFKMGIGQDIAPGSTIDNCVSSLIHYPYIQNEGMDISYTSLRATNEGQITARINELNASIGG